MLHKSTKKLISHHICDFDGSVLRTAVEPRAGRVELDGADVLLVQLKGLSQLVGLVGVLKQFDVAWGKRNDQLLTKKTIN